MIMGCLDDAALAAALFVSVTWSGAEVKRELVVVLGEASWVRAFLPGRSCCCSSLSEESISEEDAESSDMMVRYAVLYYTIPVMNRRATSNNKVGLAREMRRMQKSETSSKFKLFGWLPTKRHSPE